MNIKFKPIGVIKTPFKNLEGMPIQPIGGKDISGSIEIFPKYQKGIKDLEGFSHIVLLYFLHKSSGYDMEVIPFLDTVKRGLFSTRAPRRPNAIGLSVVRLTKIVAGIIHIQNVDMLDGTPLLDIKPYFPEFESGEDIRTGWLENVKEEFSKKRSDDRFNQSNKH